jgi:hypothetical protein
MSRATQIVIPHPNKNNKIFSRLLDVLFGKGRW